MFIGHWAPAFAAAAISKDAPKLGTLFVAAQLVDWGFFTLAAIGVEKMRIEPGMTAMNPLDLYYMPYTHSLVGSLGWAIGFALILLMMRENIRTVLIGGTVVLLHWFVDLLVHRPDLTWAGGTNKIGFGLWNYPLAAIALELLLIGGAFWWYLRRTKGPAAPPWILFALLLALQAINWFGPHPTVAGPRLYFSALAAFLIITLVAAWTGSTRWHKREVGLAVAS